MPRGLKIITGVNPVLLLIFGGTLAVFYASEAVRTYVFVSSWVAVTGLLVVMVATFVRSPLWHRLARGALYAVCLCLGVHIMGMLSELGKLPILAGVLGLSAVIFYLIGARGYLNAAPARLWFNLPAQRTTN